MSNFNTATARSSNGAPAIKIGGATFGAGHPPAFWPDIDLYFKRDMALALDLVSALADAGCRFLKAAALHDPTVCLPGEHPVSYYDDAAGRTRTEPYAAVIARHVLPLADLGRLTAHGRKLGLDLVLSIYDEAGLDFALSEGAAAVKIPSSNLTHMPLIEAAAEAGLPLVLDTGRARWNEIERAVGWVTAAGAGERLLIQHSPPGPPAPAARFRMAMLGELAEAFGRPVGLSDHHPGLDMIPLAVALGAGAIEKGLAADGAAGDIDIAHALPVSRVGEALTLIAESFAALGAGRRPDEEVASDPARMGIVAARAIATGETIEKGAVRFAFPVLGLGAEEWPRVRGARAGRPIAEGEPIGITDISVAP